MKRVLMLGYFFPPSKAAGTFRTLRFVRDLPEWGWQPGVLTVRPQSYPAADLDPGLLHKVPNEVCVTRTAAPPWHRWFKNALHAVRDRLVGQPRPAASPAAPPPPTAPADTSPLRRKRSPTAWIHTWLRTPDIDAGWRGPATWRGLWLILRQRPRVLYATGGPWTTFLIARDLSRLTRVPLVVDFRDPWAHNPAVRRRGGMLEALARRQEGSVVRQATRIVANTDVLRDTLVQAHGDAVGRKCVVIHNSYDAADYESPAPALPGTLTLSYVGSLYDAHSPEPFLRAVQRLLDEHPELRDSFRIRLVGSGAPRTSQLVLGLGLDDVVEVASPVPHAQAVALQRSSHVLLLFLTVPSDHSTFIPSKLFEYVAARRSIFAVTRGGALERILRSRNLTPWIFAPDDLEGMVTGLREVVSQHQRGTLPVAAAETVEAFSGRAAARALAAVLDAASGPRPRPGLSQQLPQAADLEPAASEAR